MLNVRIACRDGRQIVEGVEKWSCRVNLVESMNETFEGWVGWSWRGAGYVSKKCGRGEGAERGGEEKTKGDEGCCTWDGLVWEVGEKRWYVKGRSSEGQERTPECRGRGVLIQPAGGRGSILAVFAGVLYYVTGASWPHSSRTRCIYQPPTTTTSQASTLTLKSAIATTGAPGSSVQSNWERELSRCTNRCDSRTKLYFSIPLYLSLIIFNILPLIFNSPIHVPRMLISMKSGLMLKIAVREFILPINLSPNKRLRMAFKINEDGIKN